MTRRSVRICAEAKEAYIGASEANLGNRPAVYDKMTPVVPWREQLAHELVCVEGWYSLPRG